MTFKPVIGCAAYCLVHAPDLVRYGSKPWREIAQDPAFERELSSALRDFSAAERYAPNRTFIGRLAPEALAQLPRPWYAPAGDSAARGTPAGATPALPFGEILPQAAFYSLLKRADVLEPALVEICAGEAGRIEDALARHPVAGRIAASDLEPLDAALIAAELAKSAALPLMLGNEIAGLVRRDDRAEGREDENLDARTLLEGLCTKATAALALEWLLERHGIAAEDVDYVISCGEEAAGDRYQRGGGGMAKAVGEMCGCVNASGMDIKNFCAAPANALVTAAAFVAAGVYERVVVVAGGSLAKLGMKSQAFIAGGLPILDDCLAAHAFLVARDDGVSPILHLEPGAIGMASIGASTADEAVYRQLLLEPLDALGLKMTDIDKYAPELHNPEIMEHSGSGDVVHKNYRMIAAMAVRAGAIEKAGMQAFIERIGMPGFAPTQGHIPSGVAYIGHALDALQSGRLQRVMILSKASLFLNRLTGLYDGVSFVLEANPKARRQA
jgi:betaine reductase